MNTMTALLKREWWESPVLWILPAAFAGVLVLAQVYGLVVLNRIGEVPMQEIAAAIGNFAAMETGDRRALIQGVLTGMAVPFNLFLVGIMFFYALDSLYADRRDRSILFWKSMPVSDVQTVLSKLAAILLLAPAATLAVVMIFHLVNLLMGTLLALTVGAGGWQLAWDPVAILGTWLTLAWALFAQSLIYLPVVAWVMLASAWAKRAPFLWAVAPPVVLMIVERIYTGRTLLGRWLLERVTEGLPLAFNVTARRGNLQINGVRIDESGISGDVIQVSFALLGSWLLWSGVIVAAVLLAGAVWLRRYRADPE